MLCKDSTQVVWLHNQVSVSSAILPLINGNKLKLLCIDGAYLGSSVASCIFFYLNVVNISNSAYPKGIN